jgi:hypothetical protein
MLQKPSLVRVGSIVAVGMDAYSKRAPLSLVELGILRYGINP